METKDALYYFCLRLADNNMILSQRLCEWCSRGPILEEDLAISNIALDHLGQAEMFYEYASAIDKHKKSADEMAFLNSEREYFNNLLIEQPNGDFAFTMTKQFLFSSFAKLLYTALCNSNDETIKGIAAKALKEVKYHLRHSSEWMVRFGNGTDESKRRAQNALNELWRYTDDMFVMNDTDEELISQGISFDLKHIQSQWDFNVAELLNEANLSIPDNTNVITGGSNGIHTEHLGHIICEMQYLQRAFHGVSW